MLNESEPYNCQSKWLKGRQCNQHQQITIITTNQTKDGRHYIPAIDKSHQQSISRVSYRTLRKVYQVTNQLKRVTTLQTFDTCIVDYQMSYIRIFISTIYNCWIWIVQDRYDVT